MVFHSKKKKKYGQRLNKKREIKKECSILLLCSLTFYEFFLFFLPKSHSKALHDAFHPFLLFTFVRVSVIKEKRRGKTKFRGKMASSSFYVQRSVCNTNIHSCFMVSCIENTGTVSISTQHFSEFYFYSNFISNSVIRASKTTYKTPT